MTQLRKEIGLFIKNAKKKELIPCIRLNGTSDISWETTGIMDDFPDVQFDDYTDIQTGFKIC